MSGAARLAYLPWQVRDTVVKALAPALVFALMASPTLMAMRAQQPELDLSTDPAGIQLATAVFQNMAVLSIWLGGLLMMTDVIATDRDRQFYRFLFAKPVVPWRFYLQRFVVGLAAFVGVYALVPALYSWLVSPVPIAHTLLAVGLMGLLIGGIATLVGALTRRDAFVTVIVYMVTSVLQGASEADALADWMDPIVELLPPIAKFTAARAMLLQGLMPDAEVLWHVGLYGAGLVALGLFLVKRLPLAR
jgi:ABC-type polysaccharide/polyol phosphate export permease